MILPVVVGWLWDRIEESHEGVGSPGSSHICELGGSDSMLYDQRQYLRILNLYALVVEALTQEPPSDERLVDGLWLTVKLLMHATTAHWLSKGTDVQQALRRPGLVFDWPSVTVLARSALECLLAFYYVFVDPQTEDDIEFRYAAWKLGGFSQRERFPAQLPESQAKLAQEKQLNAALREKIKGTRQFQSLSRRKKRAVLKGRLWHLISWSEMAELAGLGKKYSQFLYGYLSGYAHPSSLATLQIAQAGSTEEQREQLHGALGFVIVVLSSIIHVLAKQFPQVEPILDEHPDVARLVLVYATAASLLE